MKEDWKSKFPSQGRYWEEENGIIYNGDVLETLKKLPDESVDLIITSPPYYGLRNYQVKGQIGLESSFKEYLEKLLKITAELKRVLKKSGQLWWNHGDCYGAHPAGNKFISQANIGEDGLFVRKMKQCDGAKSFTLSADRLSPHLKPKYMREKCMMMQPERLAIKMCDEQGFILRNKVVWCKQCYIKKENKTIGSVMPTSVKDRFNESWEYLYFFTKSKKYYSNLDAVRIPNQVLGVTEHRPDGFTRSRELQYDSKYLDDYAPFNKQSGHRFNLRVRDAQRKAGQPGYVATKEEIERYKGKFSGMGKEAEKYVGKNIPTIWQINPEPHNFRKELGMDVDHFAVFPKALCEIPIKFGCPEEVCRKCGRPVEKIIKTHNPAGIIGRRGRPMAVRGNVDVSKDGTRIEKGHNSAVYYSGRVVGESKCDCNVGFESGIVLDPFAGSGTALIVAKKLGRKFIGIDLNEKYCEIAKKRIQKIPKPLI